MSELVAGGREARVGGAVRRARLEAHLTLRRLADAIGVSVGTMSAIENDRVALTVARLQQIADVLGVSAPRLMISTPPEAPPATITAGDTGVRGSSGQLRLDPVLTAAADVFRATGYHGATMRLIASSADISVAGIYHHYRSKQSLLVALVDLVMSDLSDGVSAAAAVQEPAERFRAMVETIAWFHAARGDIAFIVASETRSLEEPHRRRIADVRRHIQGMLDRAALEAVQSGTFLTPSPRHTARAVATMCMALPYWFSVDGPQSPRDIASEYADLALSMMQHRPLVSD